ncbi:MAG: glycosyltransferase family 4 protein [Anaerolineae bacterium]|nr:glycosyltransferase family 4 protein [Anaerolineae bacterium]
MIQQYYRYSSPENLLLLHFSLGYPSQVLAWLEQLPDRKVLIYHNITPHTYFVGINESYLEAARAGREQLRWLSGLTDAGWGVSRYNAQELAECGWTRVGVLPLVFDPRRYQVRPDRKVMQRSAGRTNILFVGRVVPNKRFEDLIITFNFLKRRVCPGAQLILVGSARGMEPYLEFLQALVGRLGLSSSVVFTGHVSTSQLVAYYRCASVFLSMSEHEGFGMPFLESMYFGIPIVAYKAAAIPETLDGSGVLVAEKDHAAVAELIGLLLEDKALKERIVARQRERLKVFFPEQVKEQLIGLLQDLQEPGVTDEHCADR